MDIMILGSMTITAMVLITGAAVCGDGAILGVTDIMPAGMILGSTLGMIHGIMVTAAGMVAGTTLGIMAGAATTILGIGAVR